ncbi:MAG: ATP-binding protein, partial [Thermoanaerobaculia bacterium]|nr:ATP-binding protein [Thermoanaerobaculia bacterium]
ELLGVEPSAPGDPLEELLADHPELLELLSGTVERAAAVQREEIEIEPRGREASRRVLGLSAHPLRRDDGLLRGFIVLFTDLTEARRRARRDEMSRSLAQLGEIAAGVAHEMRNGLGTLKGYLGLVDHVGDDESVGDYLVEMRAETEHLERVLNDFLSFARPGTARSEPFELATVVERACADPALPAGRTRFEGAEDALVVQGDPVLLQRALRNLLDNALRAQREVDPDRAVVVRLQRRTDRAVVEIEDRGPGLDSTIRDSLLQPFVSGRPDGVGLGLALTHRIAELHDGRLEIAEREGGGVRATLELPVKIDT